MKILIIDDEKAARLNIKVQLDTKYIVTEAQSFEEAQGLLVKYSFDICYIDLKLDVGNKFSGLDLIPLAVKKGIYTVVMTSIEDEKINENAYDLGCHDIYIKGNEKDHILETINRFLLSRENFIEGHFFKDIIKTQNKKYKEDLKQLLKIIPTDISICLLGESGTGKSYLAKAIHDLSKRRGEFVEINCSAYSGDTLKSELFGHVKGSFTGATSDSLGKLSLANNGTLFLDEIGSMSLEMQEVLLKAIEERSYYQVGSNKLIKSNFRVICATLDDLEGLIKAGKFRFDLFQRLSGYSFTQPSLKDRKDDIPNMLKAKLQGSRRIIFREEAKRYLETYEWPGNIRELSKFADVISISSAGVISLELVKEFTAKSKVSRKRSNLESYQYELIKKFGMRQFINDLCKEIILKSIEQNAGVTTRAINELKISSKTFYKYYGNELKPMFQKNDGSEEIVHGS